MIKLGYTQTVHKYIFDKAYVVMRSPKNLSRPVNGKNIFWLPELSPDQSLFPDYLFWRRVGEWDEEKFASEYVPRFIRQLSGKEEREALARIKAESDAGLTVYLLCSCLDEKMCHRSILAGYLQIAGCQTACRDYTKYFSK